MHVCHFCETSVEPAYFRTLSSGLAEKGVKVSVVELGAHKPPTWLSQLPEVKYFSLGVTSKLQYPRAILSLSNLLRREGVDILQTHLYYAGLIGVLTKFMQRKTVVALTRHHTGVVRMLGTRIHISLDKWMAEHADHVVVTSEGTRDFMRDIDGIRREMDNVYTGFDFERFSPDPAARTKVREEFGFNEGDFVVGYIGNFVNGKGHIQLVRAFADISKEVPEARLFLVGRGSLEEVDKAVEELGLRDKVCFAGFREDAPACMNAMDVFVQPSLSEAFSQVLIEAMGVGLPVIATDVGGAREVVDDGSNGYLIQPNDTDAIRDKVLMLYREPHLREKIANAGRQSVRERFTIERMVDEQFQLYKSWLR
jgi:glycosyltransferase involved in cell wall biosynthesis